MIQWLRQLTERDRLFSGIIAVLLIICLLSAIVGGLIWRDGEQEQPQDQTNPTLIDVSPPGGQTEVSDQPVIYSGGEATAGQGQLQISLGEGQAQPQAVDSLQVVSGEPLSEEAIARILARLPQLTPLPEVTVDFNLPEEVLPPPRPGRTVEEPFPPPEAPTTSVSVDAGPLEVLRYGPEGEVPIAPTINVTFNQPMVPLATLEALSAEEVPVQVEPALPGTWKWLGTKTLSFEFESELVDRLPMATEYQVTIPAGTTSATGGRLADAVSWTFTTPPPQVTAFYPQSSPQPLNPLFFAAFDQRIDPERVLDTIQVTAGGQTVPIVLATAAEIEEDESVSNMADSAPSDRWLAFKAQSPLPADADIAISIGPGTPSAEGPLVTDTAQRFDFRTYSPLRVERHGCTWSPDQCPPLTPLYIEFNNPIDVEAYDESMLRIEPALPGATINIFGQTINIKAATEGRTTYRVTLDSAIQDIFGQKLGQDTELRFQIGRAEPALVGPSEALVTLDPAAKTPALTVYAINYNRLQVQAYAVQPSDWSAYRQYIQDYYYQDTAPEPPGRRVMDEIVPLEASADTLTEASIDLSPALPGDFGHLIVVVEPAPGLRPANRDPYSDRVQAWVQVTDIGLDAFADHSEMVVWTTALENGAPLSGVSIQTEAGGTTVTTDADGLARFQLPASGVSYLVARLGDDEAILPRSTSVWGEDSWQPRPVRDVLRWYVFDDRQIYRPGEEVHVKGWVRLVGGKQNGDVGLAGDALSAVTYQVYGSQGNEIVSGQADANALGGFDFAFTVPENANLGEAQILLNAVGSTDGLDGVQSYHPFQIQEFRRPEFEVSARNETTGPYFVGDQAVVAVSANYYAGGPLPNADVTWYVTSSPSSYTPPNWPDFIFGTWTPWWYDFGFYYAAEAYSPFGPESPGGISETYTGVTDATGNHYLSLDFEEADEPEPFSVVAEATVMDVNRQAWSSTTTLLVHPAEMYVGLRSDSTFVERGTPLEIETIVTDLDGNAIAGRPVQVEAARLEWQFKQGSWSEEPVDVQRCTQQSTLEPVACTFETTIGGEYQITALVTDSSGRLNKSQFTRWVSGGQRPPAREVEQETVTLIPDKEDYQPGDVAQILVQAPFTPAEGLLTVSRSGLLYTERFAMDGNTTTLQVPIEEAHIPNLQVQIDLVGSAPRTDDQGEAVEGLPPRPAYASGSLNLSIPPLSRTLSLQITPQETELEPGGETTIDVELRDAAGQPVSGAELAVIVVDEAILALSNYQLADPVTAFYEIRSGDVSSQYGRASIVLANPEELAEQTRSQTVTVQATRTAETMVEEALALPAEAPEADMAFAEEGAQAAAGEEAAPIRVRTDFNPLALFAPSVPTDSDGRAQVEVKVPDNLTRYRVMVVAVAGGKAFGMGEANLVARLPLMVRPSAPRFLNFGDQFELPVVLQNQTDMPLLVDVVVEAGNIQLTSDQGQRVSVPARDRIEVRFPATTIQPGTARFQFAAVAEDYADAATVELPVYTPATTEAFATYGVIDEGAIAQPVEAPSGVFPQFGALEISTSSTALQALTDAVLYLVSYPYECSEQLASRILAVAALRDVLTAFSAEGLPSPEEMEAAVARDIERLQRLQNNDGGFPYWDRDRESVPFNTIHVAHALERARQKGFDVPADMQQFVLEYLRQIENYYPSWYTKQTRQTLSAYALYVRDLMGDTDQAKARQLLNEAGLDELSLEATAWLWQVLIDDPASTAELEAIRRHVNNQAVETAGAANFVTSYSDDDYVLLGSNRRTDAVVLDALIADQPQSDLIPKVVNGLLAHRTRGRWGNTQENVFVLLALDRYFNTFESQLPDFVARIWLGDTYAGSHTYAGRTTERHESDIPMAYLVDESLGGGETQDLILSKEGTGRLYYRLGLRYAPDDLNLDPLDMGFVVQRVYEAVDDPGDVSQDEDGAWHFKAGARVRVKLTMVADSRRYHVALVDPLPAGLEIVNPELAVSGDLPEDPGDPVYRYGWWWGPWYEHQNMRDERAEAFTSLLWDGVYDYSYVARATTPGDFVVPPAKAEEMYSPEVFGRSASDRVIVE